jgi:phosphate transport system substrate-binding protein
MKIVFTAILALILNASSASAEDKIVIGGSGSLNDEIAELAKVYMAKNPADAVEVRPESMSTEGGLEGVRQGRFQIGLISRPPTSAEKGKLVYRAIARSMAGVVVHKTLPVNAVSEAQLCDIFSGKIKSWKEVGGNDGAITVLTRKKDDANTDTFRDKMGCFKDLKITADAIPLTRGNELLTTLDKRPGLIGIANLGSNYREHDNLKTMAINGVSPSAETARSGKYKFFAERGLVTLGEPQGAIKRFLEFMASAEGQKIIGSFGAIPLH